MTDLSKATSRGMKRWWRKRKDRQDMNYMIYLNRIDQKRMTLQDVDIALSKKMITKMQSQTLKKRMSQ